MPAGRKRKAVADVTSELKSQQQSGRSVSHKNKRSKPASTQRDSGDRLIQSKSSVDDVVESSSRLSTSPLFTDMKTVRLLRTFYDQPAIQLARKLLGKRLVSHLGGTGCRSGIIVETEAYDGIEDKASCSYGGRRTPTNEAVYMTPGTSFVYNTMGMWTCINISSQGEGAAVLIRALEPTEGLEEMRKARLAIKQNKPAKERNLEDFELCNGPAKLTKSLNLLKANSNQLDLTTSKQLWVEDGVPVADSNIVSCSRIGIARAGEWTHKPLRYYIFGNQCVSKRDKKAEELAGLV